MSHSKKIITAAITVTTTCVFTMPAQAASQDECAIWICLPGGFPQGCAAAYSAMLKRVLRWKPKPPLPPLAACLVDTPALAIRSKQSTISYVHKNAYWSDKSIVFNGKKCVSWDREDSCERYKNLPPYAINTSSQEYYHYRGRDDEDYYAAITRGLQSVYITIDGKKEGHTFYFNMYNRHVTRKANEILNPGVFQQTNERPSYQYYRTNDF